MEENTQKARWVGWKGPESKIIFSTLSLLPLSLSPDPTNPEPTQPLLLCTFFRLDKAYVE